MTREETLIAYLAWAEKHKREAEEKQGIIRFLDVALAQVSYLTIAPHVKKGSEKSVQSYTLIKDPKQESENFKQHKEEMMQVHHSLMLRAKMRAKQWQEEQKS